MVITEFFHLTIIIPCNVFGRYGLYGWVYHRKEEGSFDGAGFGFESSDSREQVSLFYFEGH